MDKTTRQTELRELTAELNKLLKWWEKDENIHREHRWNLRMADVLTKLGVIGAEVTVVSTVMSELLGRADDGKTQ